MKKPSIMEFQSAMGKMRERSTVIPAEFNREQQEAAVEAYAKFSIITRLIGDQLMAVGLDAKFNLRIERKPS
jgi:hypothetical protein